MSSDTAAKGTYCPRLWEEIFIDQNGDVFSCGHCQPGVLGNIYHQSLKDICNGETVRRMRRDSLEGRLACYERCTLLAKTETPPSALDDRAEYGNLKRLKILFGEQCNVACIMCPQDHRSRVALDAKRLTQGLDLSPFESIELQGGEPLLIRSAKEFFEYAASQSKKVSFLTNGVPINDEWAEKIALHSAFIYISLNAATKRTHELVNKGSRWEVVLKNIQRVRAARARLNTGVSIWGHMTIVLQNLEEIPLFMRSFAEFGFDAVDFGFDAATVPPYLRAHPEKAASLRAAIAAELERCENRSAIHPHRLSLLGLV